MVPQMWGVSHHKAPRLLRASLVHGAICFQSSHQRSIRCRAWTGWQERRPHPRSYIHVWSLFRHMLVTALVWAGRTKRSHPTAGLIRVRRLVQVLSPCPEARGEEAGAVQWVVLSSPLQGRKDMLLELELNKVHKPKQFVSHFLISNSLTTLMTWKFICELLGRQKLEKKVLPSRIPRSVTVKYTQLSKAAKCFINYIINSVRVKKISSAHT